MEKQYLSGNEKVLPYMQKHHHLNDAPSSNRRFVSTAVLFCKEKKEIVIKKPLARFRFVLIKSCSDGRFESAVRLIYSLMDIGAA